MVSWMLPRSPRAATPPTRPDDAPDPLPPERRRGAARPSQRHRARRCRRFDRKLLVASLAIAFGLVLIVFGLATSVTGDEVIDLPSAIEDITPGARRRAGAPADAASSSTSPRATRAGWSSTTSPLPTIRLDELGDRRRRARPAGRHPAGRRVRARQRDADVHARRRATPIDGFEPGSHTVQVIYWRTVEGEERARSLHLDVRGRSERSIRA